MQAIATDIIVRPIGPADRERLAHAFASLSEQARYQRFLHPKASLNDEELDYFTDVDHRRHESLVAVDPRDGQIIGVAEYAALSGSDSVADLGFFVAEDWRGRGIATLLLHQLLPRATANGIVCCIALTLSENGAARRLLRRAGFRTVESSHGVAEMRLELSAPLRLAA
jgi:RimJ/RimL family protein N-acetyltransferase